MTVHTRQSQPAAPRGQLGRRDDTGSVAVETALGVPLGLLVILLIVAAFHLGRATIDVNSAAAAGARAASLSRTAAAAVAAGTSAATATLAGRCAALTVDVDTSDFRRGGAVTVTVACTVTTRGLTGIGVPGSITTRAASTSPIDVYRTVSLRFTNPDAASGVIIAGSGGAA